MGNLFHLNLVYLREQKGESQVKTATALGLTRSTYANYEAGTNVPKLDVIDKILKYFDVSYDVLMYKYPADVRNEEKNGQEKNIKNVRDNVRNSVRDNPLKVNRTPEEREKVKEAIRGGEEYNYSLGKVFDLSRANAKDIMMFVSDYDKANHMAEMELPDLADGIHFRIPIDKDDMAPTIKAGDRVVMTYLPEPASTLREGNIYILLDQDEGLICRRIYMANEDTYELVSDNTTYSPYKRKIKNISAVFKVVELHTRRLSKPMGDNRLAEVLRIAREYSNNQVVMDSFAKLQDEAALKTKNETENEPQ